MHKLVFNFSSTDLMDGDVYAEGDAREDLDEPVHPLLHRGGVVEHEEDGGEELQEGGYRQQSEAPEPE